MVIVVYQSGHHSICFALALSMVRQLGRNNCGLLDAIGSSSLGLIENSEDEIVNNHKATIALLCFQVASFAYFNTMH